MSSEILTEDGLMVKKFSGQKMKSSRQKKVSIERLPFFDQLIF